MPRFHLPILMVLALAVPLSACHGAAARASPTGAAASPINCGDPSGLVAFPRDASRRGLRVGPLFFSAFDPTKDRAVIPDFDARLPTKVLIQTIAALSAPIRIEGRRCSNGERLRFEYGASWNTPVAVLMPVDSTLEGKPVDYTGYMLFTAPGKWIISVSGNDGSAIGSAIVLVQSGPA